MDNMFGGTCPLMCPAQWCRPDFNEAVPARQSYYKQCSPC
jgi:hypothetical protein